MSRKTFEEVESALTEQPHPASARIDSLSTLGILKVINAQDRLPARSVAKELPRISQAVEIIVSAFKRGGRLFYVGAGTSGRLGVLDAAECPPTFGTNPKMIRGIIAGGHSTLIRSREGVEDDHEGGKRDLKRAGLKSRDVVLGIAASKRTPYVLGALKFAKKSGCKTIFLFCNPNFTTSFKAAVEICPKVGAEVITGSTRMKAGTAQKMVLNMISTASMIKLGKVYGNFMVDLRATSEKLVERSKRTIMLVAGVDYARASLYLKRSGGSVKTALVMILGKLSRSEAEFRLERAGGFLKKALKNSKKRRV